LNFCILLDGLLLFWKEFGTYDANQNSKDKFVHYAIKKRVLFILDMFQRRESIRPKESKMSRKFEIVNMPSSDEAMSNHVYVNPYDARAPYVTVGDAYVYRCCPYSDIETGRVALNAMQRRIINVHVGDTVALADFLIPMREFSIKAVTIEAEWADVKEEGSPTELAALANAFRVHHAGHVIAKGQRFIMRYDDKMALCTVKSHVKGLVTMQTEIGVEFRNAAVDVV